MWKEWGKGLEFLKEGVEHINKIKDEYEKQLNEAVGVKPSLPSSMSSSSIASAASLSAATSTSSKLTGADLLAAVPAQGLQDAERRAKKEEKAAEKEALNVGGSDRDGEEQKRDPSLREAQSEGSGWGDLDFPEDEGEAASSFKKGEQGTAGDNSTDLALSRLPTTVSPPNQANESRDSPLNGEGKEESGQEARDEAAKPKDAKTAVQPRRIDDQSEGARGRRDDIVTEEGIPSTEAVTQLTDVQAEGGGRPGPEATISKDLAPGVDLPSQTMIDKRKEQRTGQRAGPTEPLSRDPQESRPPKEEVKQELPSVPTHLVQSRTENAAEARQRVLQGISRVSSRLNNEAEGNATKITAIQLFRRQLKRAEESRDVNALMDCAGAMLAALEEHDPEQQASYHADLAALKEALEKLGQEDNDDNASSSLLLREVERWQSAHRSLQDVLRQRERQLESASAALAEMNLKVEKSAEAEQQARNDVASLRLQLLQAQQRIVDMEKEKAIGSNATGSLQQLLLVLQEENDDKERKINALLNEGQEWSKKSFKLEQTVKEMRNLLADNERELADLRTKLQSSSQTAEDLKARLQTAMDERKAAEKAAKNSQAASDAAHKKLIAKSAENDKSTEKCKELQETLDRSYKEIARLEAEAKVLQSSAAESRRKGEREREDAQALAKAQEGWDAEKLALESTIKQLQFALSRSQADFQLREEGLRGEIQGMKRRWEEAIRRNDDSGQAVTEATAPLLRQIAALQAESQARTASWMSSEESWLSRLRAAEGSLLAAEEQKRSAEEERSKLTNIVAKQEGDLSSLRSQLSHLNEQASSWRSRQQELEQRQMELQELVHNLQNSQREVSKEKRLLELQYHNAKQELDDRQRSLMAELEAAKERELHLNSKIAALEARSTTQSSAILAAPEPQPSGVYPPSQTQTGILQATLLGSDAFNNASFGTGTIGNVLATGQVDGTLTDVHRLQQKLNSKETELASANVKVQELQRSYSDLATEVVRLTQRNTELEEACHRAEQWQEDYREVSKRHDILLELLGERDEQLEELQEEFKEVKEMYKRQIDELLKR